MITQVSGRAGRRAGRQGTVLIQTNNPQQPILQKVIQNDYKGLYEEEIQERQDFSYPPFVRLIKLTVRHTDKAISQQAAQRLADELTDALGSSRVLGTGRTSCGAHPQPVSVQHPHQDRA